MILDNEKVKYVTEEVISASKKWFQPVNKVISAIKKT